MCDQPCLPILHVGIASELHTPKPTGKGENTDEKGHPAQSTRETISSMTYGGKGPFGVSSNAKLPPLLHEIQVKAGIGMY